MAITLTKREEADILRRRASKGRAKLQGPKLETRRAKPKHGRERDHAYLAWLHDGLQCIACIRFGATGSPIEAAHQKIQAADKGLHRKAGVRPDDWQTLPLCATHHRLGPLCCDPAQGKFWAIVGLVADDVANLCAGLYAAFKAGEPGQPVITRFAALASQARAA
ncbi:hypothetical protein [Synechococcus phage Ssp-JY42]|nr:recombination enhancement function protein [Synechococcus phage Yong-M4-211]